MTDSQTPHSKSGQAKSSQAKTSEVDTPSRARLARPVGDLMGAALRSLGVPSSRVTEKLKRAWSDASDDAWRERTSLRRLEGGVLEVGVSSEALRDELTNFHRQRLLAVLRAALPDTPLIGIRFVSDPADGDGA
jgi:hypothetical protein